MREQKFEKVLGDLVNLKIGLFLSDQQFIEGVLLAVKQDHLVIDINKNIHYIARQHIKALSKNAKDFHLKTKTVPYLDRQYFTDVLSVMKYYSVTVNSSGKQTHFGVLSKIAEDYIVLINHAELLHIPKSSIADISSKISDNQIRSINAKEQLKSQTVHSATVIKEVEEMETHQLESAQDAILQTNHKTESVEVSLEKQAATIQEEEKEELQTDEIESLGESEIPQQLEVEGIQENKVELQEDTSQKEGQQLTSSSSTEEIKLVEHSLEQETEPIQEMEDNGVLEQPEISQQLKIEGLLESFNIIKANIQDKEQIIDGLELESIHMEESLDQIKNELQEKFTTLIQEAPMVVVQDEEHSSKVNDHEELSSIFKDFRVELLSYDEPLGYERSFLLPDWKIFQKDQQAMITLNNPAEGEEALTFDDHSVQINDSAEMIELCNALKSENLSTSETKNDDQAECIVEECEPSDTNRAKITFRQMSPKEEKAMLEKQYFSLAKYAAAYSMKLDERSDKAKSTLYSSIDHDKNSTGGINTSFEKQGKKNVINSLERQSALEGQYVSLMNHAAKMYRQLRDF